MIKTTNLTSVALGAALLCLVAPWSLPLGNVPVSLASMAVSVVAVVCGTKKGTLAVLIYILLGAVGLPVFSGFRGGVYILVGVTGGFIIGYLPLCLCVALFTRKRCIFLTALVGQLVGNCVLYICGTAWYCVAFNCSLYVALASCVLPFVLFDIGKIVLLSLFVPRLVRVINIP